MPPLLLLVDDAPEVALIVQRLARRVGHELRWHADVASAWSDLQGGPRPDLVLLDHNLPGPPGVELLRLLRADPAHAAVPVAVFSGWDRPEDIVAGLEAGADYVASKDLLAAPASWQCRLGEILRGCDGRAAARSLLCQEVRQAPGGRTDAESILASLNRVLRHPCVRQLDADVLGVLLRRAGVGLDNPEGWLTTHGAGLDGRRVLDALGPDGAATFAAALAEQLWCVLGDEALAPLRPSVAE
jgi:DNA-binding response OmpR family regulator